MNLKQTLFVTYYTEGDTKGNCYRSMIKAGYKERYAFGHSGTFIVVNSCIQDAIKARLQAIEKVEKLTIETVNADFEYAKRQCRIEKGALSVLADRTNFIRICENQAKHVGFYGADNLQRTEQAKLTDEQVKEAKRYAKWKLEQDLGAEILEEATVKGA